ncbi:MULTISPECIES: hypothetical protein [unclassified Snodgrassella]|uniref:hypothetical protein n=1 Tax=unclassified Snodgrassella TaxID=2625236 RepID=UPI0018DB84D7|nr:MULTISPECIES: hypothetical protein [unclassified Snodgrassella]MBI0068883.1 hypothetical protein [Snodgrassella sp. M0110]MBI0077380.1 hypothetical protein [Snodgrassella sp. M0118]MBI0079817.1 hypothetical protein [Snodgrassella sp. M0112]
MEFPPIWETVYYDMSVSWMLVSFMTLEPEQQLQYFEYPPLYLNDKDYNRPTKNVLIALSNALYDYPFINEYDEGSILVKDEQFRNLLETTDRTIYSYESFMLSNYWSSLRRTAKELLEEAELGVYPDIPKPIEFGYLVEIFDPPDNLIKELLDPPKFWD